MPRQQQREGNDAKECNRQNARAADAIRKKSADGAHRGRQNHEASRAKTGVGGHQVEFVFQETRQVN